LTQSATALQWKKSPELNSVLFHNPRQLIHHLLADLMSPYETSQRVHNKALTSRSEPSPVYHQRTEQRLLLAMLLPLQLARKKSWNASQHLLDEVEVLLGLENRLVNGLRTLRSSVFVPLCESLKNPFQGGQD